MATHSSVLAWRIRWTEEPGGLLSVGLPKVRDDWSNFACKHALEKEMAAHYSILAWRIPGTEEPGGLPSMGSHRVRHDWSNLAAAAAASLTLPSEQVICLFTWKRSWLSLDVSMEPAHKPGLLLMSWTIYCNFECRICYKHTAKVVSWIGVRK